MPFAPVDDAHTQIFYRDSGVPILNDRPYTTIFAVHGYSWNGYVFSRLLPLATASHIRLVLLNRRGYAGSTPYNDEETAAVDSAAAAANNEAPIVAHSAFMQRRGAEVARFLAWFIDKEGIPPRSDNEYGVTGGISLLGYSLGNATTLSFLGFANTFDPGLIKKLEAYLRKVVIYDSPHHALGYSTPENAYNPLFDPAIPDAQGPSRFRAWISSYFVHSPISLDLDSSLRDPMDGLEQHTPNPLKRSSLTNISSVDVQAGLDSGTGVHGDGFSLMGHARPVHEDVRRRAIFGDLNDPVPVALPHVGISYIWCTQSVWETVLSARLLKKEIASPPGFHYPARRVKFFALEGNHYAHWDDPLKTFAMLAAAVE